jgi:hypothetical protein
MGCDLEKAALEPSGLLCLDAGAFFGVVRGTLGSEAGSLGKVDDRAQAKNEREARSEQGVLLPAAGEFGRFGLLIET